MNNFIKKKNMLKNKFIELSQKMMLIKVKRQNMMKLLNIYKSMINANCDKIDTIQDIINIRETKQKLNNIPDIGIKIIQEINTELTNRENNICCDNLNKVTTLIKNEINNCLNIEIYSKEENEIEKKEELEEEKEEEEGEKKDIHKNNIEEIKKEEKEEKKPFKRSYYGKFRKGKSTLDEETPKKLNFFLYFLLFFYL